MPLSAGERLRRFVALPLSTAALALAASFLLPPVALAAPTNLTTPTIKGKAIDGKKLKADAGKWSGGKPTFSYAWERCDEKGGNCVSVAGGGAAYLTTDADVGHRLRAVVTATNSEGTASATSAPSAKIAPSAPRKKSAPAITGPTQDGQTLSVSNGVWQGTAPIAYAYQWEACAKTCESIPGATQPTYRARTADLEKKLRVIVTATNAGGSRTASSKPSAAVTQGSPVSVGAPSVAGLPVVAQTLTAEPGEWAGTGPFSYTYQWRSCNLLGECEAIAGANERTFTVGALQVADSIEVEVTAHNARGAASAASPATDLVKALLPANLELPSITGLLQDGGLLSVVTGGWSGTGPLSFSYAWELCDSAGLNCKEVSGAAGGTLGLLASMVGDTVRVIVTATNSAGSASATSEPTGVVGALLPSNTGLPSISGLLQDGSSLTALLGSWGGSGPLSFSQVWELCDASGQNCKAIEGAVGSTLGLVTSEIGSTLRVAVTATNSAGSTTATSEPTGVVGALLPSNTGLPSISGLLQDGSSLTALLGSWGGSGPLSFSQVWELCDASGQNCKAIEGAVGSTLALVTSEIGSTLRVVVTATNSAGSTTATSEPTSAVKALLPSNTGLPSIVGSLLDGSTLTGSAGSWSGSEPSFSYEWLLCNSAGGSCKPIEGAVGSTVGLVTSMIGSTLRLAVTATNSAGSSTATSEPTSAIKALLPSNTGLPSIVGSLLDGSTLTGSKGTWTGSEPAFSEQWELCNAKGEACKAIEGAVGGTLGLLTSEIGSTVRLAVTATNAAGSTTAHSEPTSLIKALLPSNTGLPSIAGSLVDGSTLTGSKGSWSGSEPSFTYEWLLCNAAGGSCKPIEGAVGSTVGLVTSMIGSTLRLAVTATNSAGSTTATSEPTSLIKALLPSNTGLPSIAGSLVDGSTLTGSKGSWTGSEPAFSEQWELCNAKGEACKAIEGAVGTTLGLLTSQIGSTVRLAVTATNAAGSTTAHSEPTSLIKALLPSNTGLPSVAGSLVDGSTLTGSKGSWTGSEPSFSYRWLLCDSAGSSCKPMEGAVGSTLGLITSEIGSTLRLAVTATNSAGSTTATSEPTSAIKALLPSNTGLPSIAGSLIDGQTLTAGKGSWSGSEPSFSYEWLVCNGKGESCKAIEGAIGATLGLVTSEIGSTLRLAVTATNSAGSTKATSEPTSAVKALLPSNTGLPSIAGSLIDGQTLTAGKGSWSGSEPSFSYEWLLCNGKGESCKAIEGAIGATLGLVTSEIGSTLRLAVTATNSAGSTKATSEPTSAIKALLPANTKLPSISGLAEDAQTLTGAKGSWTGSEPSFSQVWELCNAKGEACAPIEGATGGTLGLLTSEIGSTVRLAVTATNGAGSTTARSEPTNAILAILPKNTALPTISGVLQIGQTIEALTGKWSGSEPIKYTYQWQTCGLGLKESECTNLAGAVGKLLKLELAQVLGLTVRVLVTATNQRGAQAAASAISVKILGLALTPSKGTTAGGTEVKLTGPEAAKATAIHFGANKTTQVVVDSPEEITAVAPPSSSEGTVPVTVSTPEGTTHETPEDQFTYKG